MATAFVAAAAFPKSSPPRSATVRSVVFPVLSCAMKRAFFSTVCHITVSNVPSVT